MDSYPDYMNLAFDAEDPNMVFLKFHIDELILYLMRLGTYKERILGNQLLLSDFLAYRITYLDATFHRRHLHEIR